MNNFACPYAFILLIIPLVWRSLLPPVKGMHGDALRVPFIKDIEKIKLQSGSIWIQSLSDKVSKTALILLSVIYVLLVIAMARPQWIGEPIRVKQESRDILLITDISNSMLQPDFILRNQQIDRLTAVKKTADEFIKKRRDDRIGLILFGSRAYLQAPLTYDKNSVREILWKTDAGMAGNSTAIGDAIGLALKSLQNNKDKDKKIIILLTDGENNDGSLSLPQAIQLAKDEKIKIYTIGVGSNENIVESFFGFNIAVANQGLDEKGLKQLAKETKGTYFRAKDTESLSKIYKAIDKLEPTAKDEQYIAESKDLFYIPLIAALILSLGLLVLNRRK